MAAPPLVNPPVNLFLDNPLLPTVPLAQPPFPPLLVLCVVVSPVLVLPVPDVPVAAARVPVWCVLVCVARLRLSRGNP
ncbi:hypothetical protein [Streptomyces gilvosporeus]|uniref:hypothetical protein n=1 Tax=Streptomyces gilvosporeus TaxID=553510 RepID=UPI00131EB0FD|nr:hypothetical protein [Streptomyces gilvosporeus]